MIVLDTNILIEIEKNNPKVIKEVKKHASKNKPFLTSVTVSEFLFGISKKSIPNQVKALNRLKKFNCLNTTISSSILLSVLDNSLTRTGRKISQFDLFIASLVIDNDMTLITMDNHFKRIPGLNVIYINPQ